MAITPTRRLRVARAAAEAPGRIDAEDRQVVAAAEVAVSATAVEVLQATTMRLDVALDEGVEALRREGDDLVVRADAVRGARVVAEVDRRFGRRPAEDLAQDGQAAHPGVEDPDRAGIGHRPA